MVIAYDDLTLASSCLYIVYVDGVSLTFYEQYAVSKDSGEEVPHFVRFWIVVWMCQKDVMECSGVADVQEGCPKPATERDHSAIVVLVPGDQLVSPLRSEDIFKIANQKIIGRRTRYVSDWVEEGRVQIEPVEQVRCKQSSSDTASIFSSCNLE